tara:strand:- start:162 stop:554 length:393 start_codon:yes stop_codon:yes gene_type:complete
LVEGAFLGKARPQNQGWLGPKVKTWDAELQDNIHRAGWDKIFKTSEVLGEWLAAVRASGVAVLHSLSTKPGSLCDVAELFGFVRETNYGRWFQVRYEINPRILPTIIWAYKRIPITLTAILCQRYNCWCV